MRNFWAFVIPASFLIVALSVGYYFVFYLPAKDKMVNDIELEKIRLENSFKEAQATEKETNLDNCYEAAFNNYKRNWDYKCPEFGKDSTEPGCALPGYIAEIYEKEFKEAKELCLKRYN